MTDEEFVSELGVRLRNPAILSDELLVYINMAKRDVLPANYSTTDYEAQVVDSACVYLCHDNKFPEIASTAQGGVTTSFSSNDPHRFNIRIDARRQASWMQSGDC